MWSPETSPRPYMFRYGIPTMNRNTRFVYILKSRSNRPYFIRTLRVVVVTKKQEPHHADS